MSTPIPAVFTLPVKGKYGTAYEVRDGPGRILREFRRREEAEMWAFLMIRERIRQHADPHATYDPYSTPEVIRRDMRWELAFSDDPRGKWYPRVAVDMMESLQREQEGSYDADPR